MNNYDLSTPIVDAATGEIVKRKVSADVVIRDIIIAALHTAYPNQPATDKAARAELAARIHDTPTLMVKLDVADVEAIKKACTDFTPIPMLGAVLRALQLPQADQSREAASAARSAS